MSEGDVSLIQDEDVLRKMWQQTEDLGKRKEIRAHMYKLREERLKTLYAEPDSDGKTLQFTSTGGHTDSFADQCFQSLKSKEVRDSESPTRDYTFQVQDADNSNGGWTVESNKHVSDDGRTVTKTTKAQTSGVREVDGGNAAFMAVNESQKSVTNVEDENSKLYKAENVSKTVAEEHFVSNTDDGTTKVSSTNTVGSTVTRTSSSQKYETGEDYDDDFDGASSIHSKSEIQKQKNAEIQSKRFVTTETRTGNLKNTMMTEGELVSREVEHPDEFTKVTIETRRLPDGTMVTSTSRETKGSWTSKSGKQKSDHYDSSTATATSKSERFVDKELKSHIDSEKIISTDKIHETNYAVVGEQNETKIAHTSLTEDANSVKKCNITITDETDHAKVFTDVYQNKAENVNEKRNSSMEKISNTQFVTEKHVSEKNINHSDNKDISKKTVEIEEIVEIDKNILNSAYPKPEDIDNVGDLVRNNKTTGEYSTTYQSDYTSKKISEDNSPTHNAWASSLRSGTTDSFVRGGSPSRSFRTSTSSLRSSTSPDKRSSQDTYRNKSPEKKISPTRSVNKSLYDSRTNQSESVEKNSNNDYYKSKRTLKSPSISPERKPSSPTRGYKSPYSNIECKSDSRSRDYEINKNTDTKYKSPTISPTRKSSYMDTDSNKKGSPSMSPTRNPSKSMYDSYTYVRSQSPTKTINDSKINKVSSVRSRESSPTTSVSDIEFISGLNKKTDSVDISSNKKSQETTSVTRKSSLKKTSLEYDNKFIAENNKNINENERFIDSEKHKSKPYVRSETYEERCRKILGMPDKKTLVEDAERNLSEILGSLPSDKTPSKSLTHERVTTDHSADRELTTGVKSAELIRKSSESDVPTARKSSLKKSTDIQNQELNLVDAEFIKINEEGKVVSLDEGSRFEKLTNTNEKNTNLNFIENEKRDHLNRKLSEKDSTVKSVDNVQRSKSPTKSKQEIFDHENKIIHKTEPNIRSKSPPKEIKSRSFSPEKEPIYLKCSPSPKKELLEDKTRNFSKETTEFRRSPSPNKDMSNTIKSDSPQKESTQVKRKPSLKNDSNEMKQSASPKKDGSFGKRSISPKKEPNEIKRSPSPKKESQQIIKNNQSDKKESLEETRSRSVSPLKDTNKRSVSPKKIANSFEKNEPSKKDSLKCNNAERNKSPTKIDKRSTSPQKKVGKTEDHHKVTSDISEKSTQNKVTLIADKKFSKTIMNKTSTPATSLSKKPEPSRTILTSQKYDIFKGNKQTASRKNDETTKKIDNVTSFKKTTSLHSNVVHKTVTSQKIEKDKLKSIDRAEDEIINRKKVFDTPKKGDSTSPKMQRSLTDSKKISTNVNTDTKMTRTASDITMKVSKVEPTRVKSKPEINMTKMNISRTVNNSTVTKNILSSRNNSSSRLSTSSTKTTNLKQKTDNNLNGGVVINYQRATSSREGSPDRVCPIPLPTDSLIYDEKPRLPDNILEPDEYVRKKKIIHEVISESDTTVKDRIIEVSDSDEDRMDKNKKNNSINTSDECLLSVNQKVNKFSNVKDTTLRNETNKYMQKKHITDEVEEELKTDDCLLSVSDKVSKFINASDTKKTHDSRQISNDFIRREIDSQLENDECLLSVNDKVSRFSNTTEKKSESNKLSETLKDHKSDETTEKSPGLVSKATKMINDVKTKFETGDNIFNDIKLTVQKETIASQAKKSTSENIHLKSQTTPERTFPKTRITPEKNVPILKSTETVKKAKALFENIANQESNDISSRRITKLTDIGVYKKTSITDSDNITTTKNDLVDLNKSEESTKLNSTQKKNDDLVHNKSIISSKNVSAANSKDIKTKSKSKTETQTTSEKQFTSTNIKSDSDFKKDIETNTENIVSTRRGSGKFGIELRRTSTDQSYVSERRRSSVIESHLQSTIEDIFDLELLEQMLEKVTGYEQRRRIRGQIRVVKKNIENKEMTSVVLESRNVSPTRKTKSSSTTTEKSSSTITTKTTNGTSSKSSSPTRKSKTTSPDRKRSTSPVKNSQSKDIGKKITPEKVVNGHHECLEKEDLVSSPVKTKTSKVSEYTTAYLRRIGASNNLKTEYQPKVPNIKKEKEEIIVSDQHTFSRKTSSMNEKIETTSIKSTNVESRHTTRSPSPRHQSPDERMTPRRPSPDLKKPREDDLKTKTEYQNAYSQLKTKSSSKDTFKRPSKEVQEEKPEWARANILRKTSTETKTYTTKKVEDKNKTIRRSQSPSKSSRKPTDVITSSYGTGPTDENGRPLFGLKALRKPSTTSQGYEVKGTVITKEFYSENDGEPEGHVTITKYSTDPSDLKTILKESDVKNSKVSTEINKVIQDSKTGTRRGISSVTTTTRYSGSAGNPVSKIHKSNQPKAIEQVERPTTGRRGSVKCLTEKFIKNAVETTKTERSTYPKAGLILRTNSFKDNASGSHSSRSSTPGGVVRTSSNNSVNSAEMCNIELRENSESHSFLDNRTKVTGVQDILTRMKNADIVIEDGDTTEDAEARALLNKFLGATALMHGMSGYVESKPQTKQYKTETRTVVTKTSAVIDDVDDIWDERILRKLLEESDDYEERRKIRARLRQVMAEQEACAQIVADAVEESSRGSVEREQHQQTNGELHTAGDGNIIPEPLLRDVHGALSRLQGALRSGPAPAPHGSAILELVARLQAGLLAQEPLATPEERARVLPNRRKGKQRHTVGVTREELADARKFMEDIAFPADQAEVQEKPVEVRASPYALQKQASYGSVMSPISNLYHPQSPVRNATARPFTLGLAQRKVEAPDKGSPLSPQSVNSKFSKNNDDVVSFYSAAPVYRKGMPVRQTSTIDPSPLVNGLNRTKPILKESVSLDGAQNAPNDEAAKFVQESLMKAAAQKKSENVPQPELDSSESEEEEEEEEEISECSTVKLEDVPTKSSSIDDDRATPQNRKCFAPYKPKQQENFAKQYQAPPVQSVQPVKSNDMAKRNLIPERPTVVNQSKDLDADLKYQNKQSRKLKMKRANTIDIPKPLHCYQVESDDEGEPGSLSKFNEANEIKPKIPQFKPKTENDLKFLAFIQKQNNNDSGPAWAQGNVSGPRGPGCNWKSCFGSIKNVFESSGADQNPVPEPSPRSSSLTAGRSLWKTSDDSVNYSKPSKFEPKLNKSSVNTLTEMHEKKKFQPKLPWTATAKDEVVTGSLTVSGPRPTNVGPEKVIKLIPKPAPVNQFSHNPMSVFKPIPKKSVAPPMSPPKVWSPPSALKTKQTFENRVEDRNNMSAKESFLLNKPPIQKAPVGVPWMTSSPQKDNRVQNLATNKFEKTSPTSPQSPNIPLFKEKQFNPMPLQNGHEVRNLANKRLSLPVSGQLSAPHLVRKLENLKHSISHEGDIPEDLPTKLDTERMQIEFYEKQIREKSKMLPKPTAKQTIPDEIPDSYTYTVTDYTPAAPISTFVPLPQIPDIEDTKPQPSKKLPDLVLNNREQYPSKNSPVNFPKDGYGSYNNKMYPTNYVSSDKIKSDRDIYSYEKPPNKYIENGVPEKYGPAEKINTVKTSVSSPMKPISPKTQVKIEPNVMTNGHNTSLPASPEDSLNQKEYKAIAKVMRGPVSQQAVIKTNSSPQETYEKRDTAAKSLKGVLQKFSSPKHDVIKQIEKKKANLQEEKNVLLPKDTIPKEMNHQQSKTTPTQIIPVVNKPIQKKTSSVETTTVEKVSTITTKATDGANTKKPVSAFAKFRQLDKQNSTQSSTPSSPKTPLTPTGGGSPLFKFTDPKLQSSASNIKERLLQWCRDKTQEYENVKLDNFSTSWSDGLAFCALIHHFLPNEFDYTKLDEKHRRYNFTLAFKVADEKAGIYPLLDVDDMVAMRKPDWKCVFTYVQAIHRRFKDED